MTNGIRIQKVLSDNGILSRRKAEEAIQQNRIQVNGHPAELGQRVNIRKDIITLDGQRVTLQRHKKNVYIILHKPRGYVTTTSDEMGRSTVTDLVKDAPAKVYPIGRLDKQSEGLILLTNDGALANQIMHPSSHVSKTYRVTVKSSVTEAQLIHLATGVDIEGQKTQPASVHVLESSGSDRTVIQLTIFEGRNRQVRKMCEGVGLVVSRLKRTSVGPLKLGMLQPGKWRELTPAELLALRGSVQKATNRGTQARNEQIAQERQEKRSSRPGSWGKSAEPKGKATGSWGKDPADKDKSRGGRGKTGSSYGKSSGSWDKTPGSREKSSGGWDKTSGSREKSSGGWDKTPGSKSKPSGSWDKSSGAKSKPSGNWSKGPGTQGKSGGTGGRPQGRSSARPKTRDK